MEKEEDPKMILEETCQQPEGGVQKPSQEAGEKEKAGAGSAFEGIYDRMPDISVKALDRFILFCVLALVGVVLVGILRANHVF